MLSSTFYQRKLQMKPSTSQKGNIKYQSADFEQILQARASNEFIYQNQRPNEYLQLQIPITRTEMNQRPLNRRFKDFQRTQSNSSPLKEKSKETRNFQRIVQTSSNQRRVINTAQLQPLRQSFFELEQPLIQVPITNKIVHCVDEDKGRYFTTTMIFKEKKQENIKLFSHRQTRIFSLRNQTPEKEIQKEKQYIYKYAIRTRTGYIPSKQKTNQDSYLIYPHIKRKHNHHIFMVSDGHGADGHYVSQFLKSQLPNQINQQKDDINDITLLNIYEQLHSKVTQRNNFDTRASGATLLTLLIQSNNITCANVGDSRAIIGRKTINEWQPYQLTRDHKPTEKDEVYRIQQYGGRISQAIDEDGIPYGPLRVYRQNSHIPGLAMTRSIGDEIATNIGVISTPEITKYILEQNDYFIIIGSDGLFEFLSNDEIIKLVGSYYDLGNVEEAATALLKAAVKSWTQKQSVVDDITLLIFFLFESPMNQF